MIATCLTRRLILLGLAAAVGCFVAGVGPAKADLLWYDGFTTLAGGGDYDTTIPLAGLIGQEPPDIGQSGGAGTFFTGPWERPHADEVHMVREYGIPVPAIVDPAPTGGSVGTPPLYGVYRGCCHMALSGRVFAQPWHGVVAPEGTYYMGFLANFGKGGPPNNLHHRALEMRDGGYDDAPGRNLMLGYSSWLLDPTPLIPGLGDPYVGDEGYLALWVKDSGGTNQQPAQILTENILWGTDGYHTHSFVLRFDLSNDPASDSVRVYLDPDSRWVEPATPSAQISGIDLLLDRMGAITQYTFIGGGETEALFDELRVGTEYSDVAIFLTPEPVSLTLFGLGTVGLVLAARRKRA